MTDKEAIARLTICIQDKCQDICAYKKYSKACIKAILADVDMVLNLIKTQQKEIEKKDKIVRSIISRLDNDIKNITETKAKKREHYLDDYTRCRLKAYKTKTREIKEYIGKKYFAEEKENKDE